MSKTNHPAINQCTVTCFGIYLYSVGTLHWNLLKLLMTMSDLFYSAGPHRKLSAKTNTVKKKRGFGKNEVNGS